MTEEVLKQLLADITTELYHAGIITSLGGNISVRCATRDDAAWITPSQIFKGYLPPDQMVLIDMEGKKIEGEYDPSIESRYHASILKHRPGINAVVHSHAPLSIAFGLSDMEWFPTTTEPILISEIPKIPWYLGGSDELAFAVEKHVAKTEAHGAFLCNHGLITIGRNLREAADITLMVEHTIKILLACKLLGQEPTPITEETVDQIFSLYGL
jgi:L-fuculose-phosphate aldolase